MDLRDFFPVCHNAHDLFFRFLIENSIFFTTLFVTYRSYFMYLSFFSIDISPKISHILMRRL